MLVQMTGEDLVTLFRMAVTEAKDEDYTQKEAAKYVYGIQELAAYIGCCASTIYDLKKRGVLRDSIISKVGKKIVFNAPLARQLADEYQRLQRKARHEEGG